MATSDRMVAVRRLPPLRTNVNFTPSSSNTRTPAADLTLSRPTSNTHTSATSVADLIQFYSNLQEQTIQDQLTPTSDMVSSCPSTQSDVPSLPAPRNFPEPGPKARYSAPPVPTVYRRETRDLLDKCEHTQLPIDKLKIQGRSNQVREASANAYEPVTLRDDDMTLHTTQVTLSEGPDQINPIAAQTQNRAPVPAKRYEFIRRQMKRREASTSPTFVIEGKKVSGLKNSPVIQHRGGNVTIEDSSATAVPDFDPIAFLESRSISKPVKSMSHLNRAKTTDPNMAGIATKTSHQQSLTNGSSSNGPSVVLPMLYIEGPKIAHQLRSKSTGLPADESAASTDMEVTISEQGQGHVPNDGLYSELENLDTGRQQRAVKKNNFFCSGGVGSRVGDDYSDLCVESSSHKSKTITLQLNNQNSKKASSVSGVSLSSSASVTTNQQQQSTTKSKSAAATDKLYRSANQLSQIPAATSTSRPVFTNISSYLQFNNNGSVGGGRRAGMYTSEVYLDSSSSSSVLKPLDNYRQTPRQPNNKKLIAKYSDMEIQKELSDFFKVCPAK